MLSPMTAHPPSAARRLFSRKNKYTLVAELLAGQTGRLLDIGARDRHLRSLLDQTRLHYASADLGPGHDYQLNLEHPLDLADQAFDFVVALDVLEHVEHVHQAFFELARITRRVLIIALPNLATWPRRWSFLWRGHLGTGKYDLLPAHQLDRHRWLTVYPEINRFVRLNAARAGLTWTHLVEEVEPGFWLSPLAVRLMPMGWFQNGELTERCLYVLSKE